MATKPLTSEAIAITEKKMDMTLDDIIKMSKINPSKAKKQRVPNKSQGFLNNVALDKSAKVQRFTDSRSTLRQGALAQKRSNFQRNQFPLATEAARKAAFAPIHNRTFSRARMMNANNNARVVAPSVQRRTTKGGFAVKQQMKVVSKQQQQQQQQQQRPRTLDSMFANMKEQRMRALSQQNNNNNGGGGGNRRNLGGNQRQQQQWGRRGGRFGN